MSKAIDDVAAERKRQIEKEGWSLKHDDGHSDQSLAMAAALYAAPEPLYKVNVMGMVHAINPWPWTNFDKREKFDRRKSLVVAGALIIAEIERLDRAAKDQG